MQRNAGFNSKDSAIFRHTLSAVPTTPLLLIAQTQFEGERQYVVGKRLRKELGAVQHRAALRPETGPVLGLFIAPVVEAITLAHFYAMQRISLEIYRGPLRITPLPEAAVRLLVKPSREFSADNQAVLYRLLHTANVLAAQSVDEFAWYQHILSLAESLTSKNE